MPQSDIDQRTWGFEDRRTASQTEFHTRWAYPANGWRRCLRRSRLTRFRRAFCTQRSLKAESVKVWHDGLFGLPAIAEH